MIKSLHFSLRETTSQIKRIWILAKLELCNKVCHKVKLRRMSCLEICCLLAFIWRSFICLFFSNKLKLVIWRKVIGWQNEWALNLLIQRARYAKSRWSHLANERNDNLFRMQIFFKRFSRSSSKDSLQEIPPNWYHKTKFIVTIVWREVLIQIAFINFDVLQLPEFKYSIRFSIRPLHLGAWSLESLNFRALERI